MPIDASIYQAFAPRQKGALDYAQEFAGLDASRQAQQAGALNQQMGQAKFDEYQRGVQDQAALRQLMGSLAGKDDAAVLAGLRGAGRFNEAGAMEEGLLKRQKLGVDVREGAAKAGKTEFETKEAKKKQAILDIAVLPDFDGARASISAKVTSGELPMQMAQGILQSMPQDPAQFATWKNNLILKMAAPEAQLTAQTQTRGQDITAQTAAAQQALTAQNQAAQQAIARGQLAVAQGHLGVARERFGLERSKASGDAAEGTSPAPTLGVPRPAVVPWANQTNARDANKVKGEEAKRGAKELDKDEEAARAAAAAANDAKRFLELNAATSSGGASRVGAVRAVRGAFSSDVAEMEGITARLAPAMRQPGSGATSDYDAKMFERGTVGLDKPKATNDAIAAGIIARAQQSQDYALFRQTYLEQNGTLQGSDRYWKQYVTANPIFDPKAKTPTINAARVPWRDYFSGGAPAAPAAAPAAPAKPAGGGFKYLGTE